MASAGLTLFGTSVNETKWNININFIRRPNININEALGLLYQHTTSAMAVTELFLSYCTLIKFTVLATERKTERKEARQVLNKRQKMCEPRGGITLWNLLSYLIGLVAWEVSGDIDLM